MVNTPTSGTSKQQSPDLALSHRVSLDRVQYITKLSRVNIFLSPLGAVILCLALWDEVDRSRAFLWVTALVFMACVRILVLKQVPQNLDEVPWKAPFWEKALGVNIATVGVVYGLGAVSLLTGRGSDAYVVGLVMVMAHGTAGSYLAQPVYGLFTVVALAAPTLVWLLLQPSTPHRLLGLLAVVCMSAIARVIKLFSRYFVRSHQLTLELELEKERITESYHTIQQMEVLRDSLTHMLVHDLRAPLSSVVFYSHLLEDNFNDKDHDESLEHILKLRGLSDRMSVMVDTILDTSRLESESVLLNLERVELSELFQEIKTRTCASQDRTRFHTPGNFALSCDRELITRVVLNLIDNALRYSPPERPVEVSAHQNEVETGFRIVDYGPGVPVEQRERIFEKFVTVEQSSGSRSSGLGLTFCRLVVEKHDGRIGVCDAKGGGTMFYIHLPNEAIREGYD